MLVFLFSCGILGWVVKAYPVDRALSCAQRRVDGLDRELLRELYRLSIRFGSSLSSWVQRGGLLVPAIR